MRIVSIWQDLCDKDDRTSPEEYPDMCLITRDELEALLLAEREDCALLAFSVVMRTLTVASRKSDGTGRDALLDAASALAGGGRAAARVLALGQSAGEA